jgi:hypothetical protein
MYKCFTQGIPVSQENGQSRRMSDFLSGLKMMVTEVHRYTTYRSKPSRADKMKFFNNQPNYRMWRLKVLLHTAEVVRFETNTVSPRWSYKKCLMKPLSHSSKASTPSLTKCPITFWIHRNFHDLWPSSSQRFRSKELYLLCLFAWDTNNIP